MVGGTVVEVLWQTDRIWIDVHDVHEHRCAIYVQRNAVSERIKPGDGIWWQGKAVMWTPKANRPNPYHEKHHQQGTDFDIIVYRIGYSGARHPARAMIERAFNESHSS